MFVNIRLSDSFVYVCIYGCCYPCFYIKTKLLKRSFVNMLEYLFTLGRCDLVTQYWQIIYRITRSIKRRNFMRWNLPILIVNERQNVSRIVLDLKSYQVVFILPVLFLQIPLYFFFLLTRNLNWSQFNLIVE